jgi:hypothetical protein
MCDGSCPVATSVSIFVVHGLVVIALLRWSIFLWLVSRSLASETFEIFEICIFYIGLGKSWKSDLILEMLSDWRRKF